MTVPTGFKNRAELAVAAPRRGSRPFLLLLPALAITLSSCVWLHVLELKNQLTDFEKNFTITVTDHFVVGFLDPALYAEDYFTLAKVEPTKKIKTAEGSRWIQVFTKLDASGNAEPDKTVVFSFDFDKEDLLVKWDFSPNFLVIMPPKFLEAAVRSLGKGKVNQAHKQVQVAPEDIPKVRAEQPTREQIVATLGKPSEITQEDGLTMEVYRFRTETTYVKEEFQARHQSYANLYYEPGSDVVEKVSARFLGLKFAVDFRNFIELRAAGKNN